MDGPPTISSPYYRPDLALVHHRGFGSEPLPAGLRTLVGRRPA